MIKAVIFDMDGVLIDARDWHYEALNRALRLFGMEISRFDHLTTFDGLPTRRKLTMLTAARGLPPALHDFLNEMKQRYTMEIVAAECKPTFGQQYALSRLHAEGYRLAVCSNSVRDSVEVMMQRADLERYLEFMVSNQDVTRAKPDPEMYQVAIDRMGLAPHEALIVEDNENGVAAARAAGAHVLEVGGVEDVTYHAIMARIEAIQAEAA
ncbi:HAD family phosphatase [Brevundimonas sp. S30B]|uniref:HAD family hydrolase n=1 Tax=unclassified Brevundimonas TaxID=2622653 RepID=UPI001071BD8E|nr:MULTISPECIES: HAD family phosphatase [unclassified Brevundimonas]QBX38794.1 HAD family phosphatase [Brevundimonas sp. MF30-B]TFW01386.1 HAD family phosphatase [Brevundimonas sp. S30B]